MRISDTISESHALTLDADEKEQDKREREEEVFFPLKLWSFGEEKNAGSDAFT